MTKQFKQPTEPRVETLEKIPADFAADKGQWLVETAAGFLGAGGIRHALIHADDGVLWGLVTGNQLTIPDSSDWTPALRSTTIQQCRIFGDKGELFIWREAEGQWRGRVVIEDTNVVYEKIEEAQILYGNRVNSSQAAPAGFTPIFEKTTGIRQIVPKQVTDQDFDNGKCVILTVVHYLDADSDGQARYFCSRLKDINVAKV